VLAEAYFYGIESAIRILSAMVDKQDLQKEGVLSLTRKDVLKAIMSTPNNAELRFQGVDFVRADLSKLDLRNINFKVYSSFVNKSSKINHLKLHIFLS